MKNKYNTQEIPAAEDFRLSAPKKIDNAYTWETKVDVATRYMMLGNMRLISEQTRIPYDTLLQWKRADWWGDLIEEIRKAKRLDRASKLSKIVDRTLDIIEDRLDNGDFILNNKTGAIERKPVSMKDANSVAKDLIDRQITIEKIAEGVEARQDTVQDTLKLLATEFAKWNRINATKDAQTVEFKEVLDAVHEEREEGLQEGSGPVYLETGSEEEESTAERS